MDDFLKTKTILIALAILLSMPIVSDAQVNMNVVRDGDAQNVIIKPHGKQTDQGVTPLDEPDVYFDSDEMALSLHGWDSTLASYYVEVVDYCSVTVTSETVPGYGLQTVYLDPLTVSGTATVTITTSRGDEYTGTFYIC